MCCFTRVLTCLLTRIPIVHSIDNSIVEDDVGYLRNLCFEIAFIGESEKLDKDVIEGNIKAQFLYERPE